MTTNQHNTAPTRPPEPDDGEGEPGGESAGETSIPVDDRFAILKNWRRRAVLAHLDDHGGHSTLSDLAEVLGAQENGVARRDLSSSERKRVYVGLYQCHLPRLDDVGAVDFDKRSGDVALRPAADQLLPYVREEGEGGGDGEAAATRDRPSMPGGAAARAGLAWVTVGLLGLSVAGVVGTPGTVVALAGLTVLAGFETAAVLRSDEPAAEEL